MPNNLANATQPMDTTNLTLVTSTPARPAASLGASADPEFCPIALAPIPPVMGTDTDAARQFYRNAVSQLRMPPLPAAAKIAQGAQAASQIILGGGGSSGADFQTNNVDNPVQTKLNLTGSGVSYGPGPGQVQIATGGGDGLTHGRTPWPGDPSSVILVDDFHANLGAQIAGSALATGIGQLGWNLQGGSNARTSGFFGGGGLNIGMFSWQNSASASGAGMMGIVPTNTGSESTLFIPGAWALAANPGSVTTFVFKTDIDPIGSSPAAFSTTQKALYIGYTGPTFNAAVASGSGTPYSRPDIFVGLRYDTSAQLGSFAIASVAAGTGVYTGTFSSGGSNAFAGLVFNIAGFTNAANNGSFMVTASSTTTITTINTNSVLETHVATAIRPALNDSFFTLEIVANPTFSTVGRNNTQGSTVVTNVAPVAGAWHRVDIYFNQTGKVTVTLDGSTTNSLTATMPTFQITGTITGQVQNDKALISWSGGTFPTPVNPWDTGAVVTPSGFTSGRGVLNVPLTVSAGLAARFTADLVNANVGGASDTVTLSGYPSLTPLISFGNDDTASPTGGNMAFFIDYFSFVQNANLGPNAPGTVVATNSRYF